MGPLLCLLGGVLGLRIRSHLISLAASQRHPPESHYPGKRDWTTTGLLVQEMLVTLLWLLTRVLATRNSELGLAVKGGVGALKSNRLNWLGLYPSLCYASDGFREVPAEHAIELAARCCDC